MNKTILEDVILNKSNSSLISICNRWNTSILNSKLKAMYLNSQTICTFVYSNSKTAFFCKNVPDSVDTWKCCYHLNSQIKDVEFTTDTDKETECEKYFFVLFPLENNLFVDVNTLKILNSDLIVIGQFHVIDNLFYFVC